MLMKISIFLSLLFLVFTNGQSPAKYTNETLKVRLNVPFFKFFSKNGHHVVDEEIPKITIPEIKLPFSSSIGKGVVKTNDLKIEKFSSPKIDFNLSNTGIRWWTSGGAIKLSGKWHAKFTELITIRDKGWLNAYATGIQMNISAAAYQLDGQPQVRIGECTVQIQKLDVEIGGSVISWLVNLFETPFSKLIKKVINEQACTAARGILIDEANRFLHSLPSHVDIGANFYVDYFLTENPHATRDFTEFDLAADIVYGKSVCHPVKVGNWTDASDSPGMLTTWMSVSIPNCLIESAHQNQLVKVLISKDISVAEPYLRTSCGFLGLCIGKFFKKLRTDYPNNHVDLFFHTYSTPYFEMSEKDGVMLNMSLAVDLFINPYAKTKENILARLVVDTQSDVEPYLNNTRIHGHLLNSTITARVEFSNIGTVSGAFLRAFSSVLSMTAREAVRSVLGVGIPIPSYDNVTIADSSHIEVFDQYLRANIDFEFK
ncbi:hypothetical protein GCK72_011897 [Caenorhabditis remanei]|uniref:Lipid-binding serum glycoprotein C-terminal domain-containing protein n=1 Tax=Caenorhabditis remanei TaxID=31234 RepID=A0A6A5H720_CAERE|nr:hypothetical protein GCK72_011897 [Caenorhabditis remanei]KAF1763630.1 hypothetical protein GCK72_011897 [Caenorhabditis remanei]